MSDRDDEDDSNDATSDRPVPQLGLPIDPPPQDTSPRLREPRLSRAPSFSAPANDRPGTSGDRARLSAPLRTDGTLFDRQPPPFRRPSTAPPPLPLGTTDHGAPSKSAPVNKPAPAQGKEKATQDTPPRQAQTRPEHAPPQQATPKQTAPVQTSPTQSSPTQSSPRQSPPAVQAPPRDSTPLPAAQKPVVRAKTPGENADKDGDPPHLRARPEPRVADDFKDLPEPPRPRLTEPRPAPEAAAQKPAQTAAPVSPSPTAPVAPKAADTSRPKPATESAPKTQTEPTQLRPRKTAEPSSSTQKKPAAKAKPVLVAKNEGLVVHSLGKQFKKRPVLRDVSLRVQRGEAVGLLGPNGAGKTTCFYIVTGLISADYGQIELDGVDITELPMYRRSRLGIGYLPQESSIFRGLTVEQNIMAVLELIEKNRERREITLESLLAEFSISHLRRTPAIALSGGERRRLEIARALASQPNFVLLDEPLAGIDPIAVRDIRELVSHLKDRGIGVLITDHNVRETLDIVDRAYILHDGNVLMEGTPDEIVANQEVRRVYLGDRFSL